jgi:hypothetical protein
MAIEAIVDSLDNVPAHFHELYTEQNGKYVVTGVTGVKPVDEFNRVYTGLTKERDEHKATKGKLAAWASVGTVEEVQAKLDRIAELETAAGGKLDDAAINKLVETRMSSKTAPLQRQIDTLTAERAERDTLLEQYRAKDVQRNIHDNLREALKKHEGFQASAFDDAAMLAERVFTVDEDGRVVTKDNVGVTPGVDVAVWLAEMQAKRPHWWGPSAGGGAPGNRGAGTTGGTNPFSAEGWNVTAQGAMLRDNAVRAEQMAKAAGTTIGGPRPAPKR